MRAPSEKTVLIPTTLTSTPILNRKEKAFKWFGWTCTTMAMTAQGFLGLMLMDYYLFKNLPIYLRAPLDLAFFIAAEESKRRIVINHCQQKFIDLANFKPRKSSLKSFFWHLLFNIPLTFGGVYAFTGITGMSLDGESGGASLLRDYGYHSFDVAANVLDSRGFQMPFMLAATFANIVFFPAINRLAWNNIKNWISSPLESAHHRTTREEIIHHIEAKRIALKNAYENSDTEKTNQLLNEVKLFVSTMMKLTHSRDIYDAHLKAVFPERFSTISPKRNAARFTLGLAGFIGTAIGVIGFSNFYGLCGAPVLTKMTGMFTQLNPEDHLTYAPVFGALGYAAMISVAAGIIPALVYEIPRIHPWAGNKAHVNVSSTTGRWLNVLKTLLICVLGSTPNIYQSKKLQEQALWLVVFAGMASILIEFQSARHLCWPINRAISRKDTLPTFVEKADRDLVAIQNNPEAITAYKQRIDSRDRYQPWIYRFFRCRCSEDRTDERRFSIGLQASR